MIVATSRTPRHRFSSSEESRPQSSFCDQTHRVLISSKSKFFLVFFILSLLFVGCVRRIERDDASPIGQSPPLAGALDTAPVIPTAAADAVVSTPPPPPQKKKKEPEPQHVNALLDFHSSEFNEQAWNEQELAKWTTTQESSASVALFAKYALHETLQEKVARIATPIYDKEGNKQAARQIIATTTTFGFRAYLYNWLCSIKNLPDGSGQSILDQVIIYTPDSKIAWELITQHNFFNVFIDKRASKDHSTSDGSSLSFQTLGYQRLILYRTEFIKKLLVTSDLNVIIADNDSVWLRNPIPYLLNEQFKEYDLIAQDDSPVHDQHVTCGGFLYMKNTGKMKEVWRNVTLEFTKLTQNAIDPSIDNEQQMIQRAATRGQIKVAYLPGNLFPNGMFYFDPSLPRSRFADVYVVHNNYAIGAAKKQQRFRKYPGYLWQVDALSNYQCIPRQDPVLTDEDAANAPVVVPPRPGVILRQGRW